MRSFLERPASIRWLWLALGLPLGCTSVEPALAPAPSSLDEAPELVLGQPVWQPPEGADGPPRSQAYFRMPDGTLREVDRLAIAHVPRWGRGAALVDPEGRLYEVMPGGDRRMLAAGATGSLAVSPDARLLAYVIRRDALGELRVHDGQRERVLAADLASIGGLSFGADRIAFVGGRPGGVAGVWIAPLEGEPVCLTNCDLRTGEPWLDRFVPLPASEIVLDGSAVRWIDEAGAAHEVTR